MWQKSLFAFLSSRENGQKLLSLAVERAQIVVLHEERFSERQFAKNLQFSKVHRAIEKIMKHGT